jgi:ArsR family transcriptional regulator
MNNQRIDLSTITYTIYVIRNMMNVILTSGEPGDKIRKIHAEKDIYIIMNINYYQTKANLFQVLSHPVRLQILDELRKRQACVCHLQAVTHRPQAYISQQLRILREAELVDDEKDGQNVFYRLKDELVRSILHEALGPAGEPSHPGDCNCPVCSDVKTPSILIKKTVQQA